MKAETAIEKAAPRKVKTTRGDIEGFNRSTWNYMKKQHGLNDTQLIHMNAARWPAKVNAKPAHLFRYFSPEKAKEKSLAINDYESLNDYPDLILYEGFQVLGRGGEINIQKRDGAVSFLQEKMQKGEITEAGIVIEKTAAQKFLGGFGRFLMMGGFMVVLLVIVGIVIAVSVLAKSC
jgi:hypothetical protein